MSRGDAVSTINNQDLPLAFNQDGSLSFFWFDAHEENTGADIFLFGKVYQPETKDFVSCALKVNGMKRIVFALPKSKNKARGTLTEEEQKKQCMDVYTELEDIRKKSYPNITTWRCKPVNRKYAFEMPIAHGEHKFLKIKYDSTMPTLNPNMKGATFDCLFGAN